MSDSDEIIGIECKNVCYSKHRTEKSDLLTVKEVIHRKSGKKEINLRFIKDFKRPFWITKKMYRTHKDKKTYESAKKLDKYQSLQCNLTDSIVRAFGYGNPKSSLKQLAKNPYLYGADILPETLIKKAYQDKYPNCISNNSVAVLDYETDVNEGTGDPIVLSLTMSNKCFTAVNTTWFKGFANPEKTLRETMDRLIGNILKERNIEVEFFFTDCYGEMTYKVIQKAHEWKPDFIAVWNIDFDIQVAINALTKKGYDLAEVFSDPSVPEEYRYFKYTQGIEKKKKADGTEVNLAPEQRWHWVDCPASFVFIDSMCVYAIIRMAAGKEPSYSLDSIMKKNLDIGKLYFKNDIVGDEGTIEWHKNMQYLYKPEYVVYNQFDCIGINILDDKTIDLKTQISSLSGASPYSVFNSNPKKIIDKYYFFLREQGNVAGTLSDKMSDEADGYLPGTDGIIVTLDTQLLDIKGIYLLEEGNLESKCYGKVSDADITMTYPSGEIIQNVSKETTIVEMGRIQGLTVEQMRLVGFDLTGGKSNAYHLCQTLLNFPTHKQWLEAYRNQM